MLHAWVVLAGYTYRIDPKRPTYAWSPELPEHDIAIPGYWNEPALNAFNGA